MYHFYSSQKQRRPAKPSSKLLLMTSGQNYITWQYIAAKESENVNTSVLEMGKKERLQRIGLAS